MKTLFLQLQDELEQDLCKILSEIEAEADTSKKQLLRAKFAEINIKYHKIKNFLTANYR